MTGAHDLLGLSFSTVGGSPQDPALLVTDCVAGVPELWCYSRIARTPDHFSEAAVLYPVSFFAVELEVVSFLVDDPAVVRVHEYSISRIFYQLIIVPVSRFKAHIGHSNNREFVGVGSHAAITPSLSNMGRCSA